MRSTLKLVVPLAVAALALGACGTKGGDTSSAGGSGGAAKAACDQKIGMFGALTGPNANLGIYIQNGVNLALDDYNKKHADCKVTLENYDSQGRPDPGAGPGEEGHRRQEGRRHRRSRVLG